MAEYIEYDWRGQSTTNFHGVSNDYTNQNLDKNSPKAVENTVNSLRRLCASEFSLDPHLRAAAASQTDESLSRFARARKCDLDKGWKLLINYHKHKETLNEMPSVSEQEIRCALLDGLPGVLAERDRRGHKVILLNAFSWDGQRYSILAVYKALLLTLEKLSFDEQNQLNGFVLIIDWTGFPLKLSTQLGPRILRLMAEGVHDCFPVKFKAVHFVNRPWHVEAVFLSVRGILSDKAKKRIFNHGNNLSTLHEHVAKDILPTELGGEQCSYNPMVWIKELEQSLVIENPSDDIS